MTGRSRLSTNLMTSIGLVWQGLDTNENNQVALYIKDVTKLSYRGRVMP